MSRNVYADISYPNAELMLQKAKLVLSIKQAMRARRFTPARTAKLLGFPLDRFKTILEGDFEDIDLSRLVDCLHRLGHDVHVEISPLDSAAKTPGKFEVVPPTTPRLSA